jgi:hypothetical protein
MKTSFISLLKYPRCLGYLVAFLAVALFSVPALAQDHGVGVGKSCPTATKVGDLASCTMSVANEDEYGDTLEIHEFWDLVGMGMDQFRNPPMGNLPIVAIDDPVVCPDGTMAEITCAMGDGPIGLVFPCEMGGCATPPGGNGSMLAVTVMSEYIVPDGSEDPLLDQANVIVDDMCDAPDTIGCNPNPQQQQFGAAVSLFEPSIAVTKTGPPSAKVGDEIIYTVIVEDTSTGTGFPGFENCVVTDDRAGGPFPIEPGVPFDYPYVVDPDDPDPLVNIATVTCDVVGFDNVEDGEAEWSVGLFEPSIAVTKTGPPSAKVGDEIIYTVIVEDTSTGSGFPGFENCVLNDSLAGGPFPIEPGVPFDYPYVVQPGPDPLLNEAIVTCEVIGFDNEVPGSATHEVGLFEPDIEVDKTGPPIAKAGDEIIYTVIVEDTSTGSGFPGFENCVVTDDRAGGPFPIEPGVPFDYSYVVQPDDPDPLVNIATVTCDVIGFDNQESGSAEHTVDLSVRTRYWSAIPSNGRSPFAIPVIPVSFANLVTRSPVVTRFCLCLPASVRCAPAAVPSRKAMRLPFLTRRRQSATSTISTMRLSSKRRPNARLTFQPNFVAHRVSGRTAPATKRAAGTSPAKSLRLQRPRACGSVVNTSPTLSTPCKPCASVFQAIRSASWCVS